MIYQCERCDKVYSKEDLIDYLIKIHQIKKLSPVCPNCKGRKFEEYNLTRVGG